ncbi:MAG: hypothetical protein OHK0038_22960 [Flammeovirgaceae bacterium]
MKNTYIIRIIYSIFLLYSATYEVKSQNNDADLPVISASGGGGRNINWQKIKEEEEADKDGPGFFYHDCDGGNVPLKITNTSSFLAGQGSKNYNKENLNDDNPMTAWVEGVKGYGIGEWFELTCNNINEIYNGYQSSVSTWINNSRVKKFKIYLDNKPLCFLLLTDEMGAQHFTLPFEKDWDTPHTFRFEIIEVYKGAKWDDVGISEIAARGCCFLGNTQITIANNQVIEAEKIEKGEKILTYNIDKQEFEEAKIIRKVQRIHFEMLKISTLTKKIIITPEHLLYVEGEGFTSFYALKAKYQSKDWYELLNFEIKILTFNSLSNQLEYEPLKNLEKISGNFQTYSITQLEGASSYIANGFVNGVYGKKAIQK